MDDFKSILSFKEIEKTVWGIYDYKDVFTITKNCFNKRFNLEGLELELPHVKTLFSEEKWKDSELQCLKVKLNDVKNKLNDFNQASWHKHTNFTNPAYSVMRHVKKHFEVELLTQAWCKFHEIVNAFNIIPETCKRTGRITSVHLCEAPGAFVTSLNHYLRTHIPYIQWMWIANSLNPFYEGNDTSEMIQDDRLMIHTLSNWYFGPDDTGNVKHPSFHFELKRTLRNKEMPKPLLVTADGSRDCQDNPEEQELIVSELHRKEALIAMEILDEGGTLVLKMFTMFECDSICLMYLLSCLFNSIDVVKPATSKEGNSECYVVCCGYKGFRLAGPYLRKISEFEKSDAAMFPYSAIPAVFLEQLFLCSSYFTTLQMEAINRNIELYSQRSTTEFFSTCLDKIHKAVCQEYIRRNKLRKLPDMLKIISPRNNNNKLISVLEVKNFVPISFTENQLRSSLVGNKFLSAILNDLDSLQFRKFTPGVDKDIILNKGRALVSKVFDINLAKPIEHVNSSQFCYCGLIKLRNKLVGKYGVDVYRKRLGEMMKKKHSHEISVPILNAWEIYSELSFNEATCKVFKRLYCTLLKMRPNEDYGIDGLPLLTQFNVGLLRVLAEMFHTVEFVPPCLLLLKNYRVKDDWLKNMRLICTYFNHCGHCNILSFLPLTAIVGSLFYNFVIDVNNTMVSDEITLFCGNGLDPSVS